jgi:hypothetical protein
MKVRLSAGRTALELNAPRNRVFARYGAQKLPTIRIPSQRLLSEALLRRMVRKNSGATPGLAEMAETGGNWRKLAEPPRMTGTASPLSRLWI